MLVHGSPHLPSFGFCILCFLANKTANVTVEVSEDNRPENKSAFYAGGNITINASAILLDVEEFESPLTQSRSGWYRHTFPCLELFYFCSETVVSGGRVLHAEQAEYRGLQ